MNDTKDAANEICAAIYLVGAGLADSAYLSVMFGAFAIPYFIAILNAARKMK